MLGNELRVLLGLLDLDDVELDFLLREVPQLVTQLVDLAALAPDDHAGARRVDVDRHLLRPLHTGDLDLGDPGVAQAPADVPARTLILEQPVRVVLAGKPARAPGPNHAKAKPDGMRFLAQAFPPYEAAAAAFDAFADLLPLLLFLPVLGLSDLASAPLCGVSPAESTASSNSSSTSVT